MTSDNCQLYRVRQKIFQHKTVISQQCIEILRQILLDLGILLNETQRTRHYDILCALYDWTIRNLWSHMTCADPRSLTHLIYRQLSLRKAHNAFPEFLQQLFWY